MSDRRTRDDHDQQKRAALYGKLQHLRSLTHSTAENKTSIIVDASKYIEELKDKVERLDQESSSTTHGHQDHDHSLPIEVKVKSLKKGFLINVYSGRNCPDLLVSVLEAFEDVGLDVIDAKVSCSDNFHLQVIGAGQHEEQQDDGSVDAQGVKQAVLEAINRWISQNNEDVQDH